MKIQIRLSALVRVGAGIMEGLANRSPIMENRDDESTHPFHPSRAAPSKILQEKFRK
jgi:hypothetical protein